MNIKKTLFVSGVSGYIGSIFAYEAIKRGYKIIGVDNFSNSSEINIKKLMNFGNENFVFYELDISNDFLKLKDIILNNKIEYVIHFAGLKSVAESEENPFLYWQNNVNSTNNILNIISKNNIPIVFSSSATIYGDANMGPVNEDSFTKTSSSYGSTKLAQEILISDYSRSKQVKAISLRYFNPVGSDAEHYFCEDYNQDPSNLMPRLIRAGLGLDKKIFIFGNDYNTKDGTAERDYIHVIDLIEGHFAAILKIDELEGHNIFNLGTGKKTSVKRLIETFIKINKVNLDFEYASRREGDIEISYANPSRANNILNWKARCNLEDMCRDAWLSANNNLKQ